MKKLFRVLCIGLLVIVCSISLLLCACGDPNSDTDNPNPGTVTPPNPDDDPPNPDEKKTFTVTFDMNGYGVAIASKSAKEGETIEAPEDPSAPSMTFGGWYKNAACTEAFDFDAPLTANATVYAKWTPSGETPEKETFTVTFDMNGYGVAIASKSAKEGETIEAPEAPSALFMTFGGWYKNAACTEAFDFDAPLTANATVYAKWTPSEEMPETGYSPDAPKSVILDGVSVSDDIASGTTLYYTFTATNAGRYGFSIASNGDVAKLDYAYTASSSTAEELKENAGLVNGEYNFYLTLAAEETVSISVVVKEGETISVENPSDARVSVFTVTDEPLPDGIFLEGLYKGSYGGGYMTIYFRITDRARKAFTMGVDSDGTTENIFTYLNGVVTIAQGQSGDWGLGLGTMTWEAPEEEGEPAIIHFVGGKTSIGSAGAIEFVQYIPSIELAHDNWIGEYEAIKDDAEISTIRIGKKYVQIVKSDGTIAVYFTELSNTYNNYAVFTNAEITCGNDGSIVIRSEKDGHVEQIRAEIGGKIVKLALKSEQVVEIPYMLPLVEGATYTATATVDEEEVEYSLTASGSFWVLTGLTGTEAAIVDILDYDGNSTYYAKATVNTMSGTSTIKYCNFKLILKDGKVAVELYEDDTLIVTLVTDVIDVSANTYVIKEGENTGSICEETGYAYITLEETKSYIFTGEVKIYKGVNISKPGDDDDWTELTIGEMVNLDGGSLLAVKPTGEGSSFTFSAQIKAPLGTDASNPIVVNSSYTHSTIVEGQKVYVRFVALVAGEYTFSSAERPAATYNYEGGALVYNVSLDGETETGTEIVLANSMTGSQGDAKIKYELEEGGYVDLYMYIISGRYPSCANHTVKVSATCDFSDATELTLDDDLSGSVDEDGIYKAEIATEGVTGLSFNADVTFKIVLSDATVKNGKSIDITVEQLQSGFKLICSGEVSYKAVWASGYAKNPYALSMSSSGSDYTWRDVEGNGTYFTFTAPKAENYSFRFATEAGQYFIYNGEQHNALTLELTEGQEITFRANKEAGDTSTTFTLLLGYNYFENATEISFAADESATALTAGNHKVTEGTLANSTDITFTSQSSFKILYTNGNEAESTQADGVHTITVSVSQMDEDTVFKLEAESEVSWKVVYKEGTIKNPVKLTINAQTSVATTSNGVRYVTVTAPENIALGISVGQYSFRYSFNNRLYYIYPTFTIVGDESGTKYGYANNGYTTNKNTVPAAAAGGLVYTLAAGETVTLQVQYLSPLTNFIPDLKGYNFTVYYSFADDNTTALDWTAESKTLSAGDVKVYKNANAEVASIKLTADKAFTVYHGASATSTPTRVAATLTDNVYTVTVTNRYFFLDYGENTEITYAVVSYAVGASNNPATITSLGNTNISYTSAYTDGKYYVTVTVAEAGNYVLAVADGYTITGEGLTDGVVAFTADALSKTFAVVSNSYTAGGNTITATVAVSVTKKLETQTLTFNSAVGSEGVGTLALQANSAYIVGAVVVTESLDKYISSIVFTSAAAFFVEYPDGTTATATQSGEVYTLSITVANAKKGFMLTAEKTVTYAIDWAVGSYLNPVKFNAVNANGTNVNYTIENVVYVKVENNSEFDWLVSFTGTNITVAIVSGGTAGENGIVVAAGGTSVITVTNNADDATIVSARAVIVNNFKVNATELAFSSDEDTEGTGTTMISTNSCYKVGTIDADAMNVVFRSESAITVSLADGKKIEGTEVSITVEEARGGFHIAYEGEITYEIEWYPASAHNIVVLGVETKQITFRKGFVSYAEFTATEDGFYAFKINTAGYVFTLGDDETPISSKKEIELTAGTKIAIKISATTANPSTITAVSMTVSYSTEATVGFPADMIGTWTASYTFLSYGMNEAGSATIVVNNDGTIIFSAQGGWLANLSNKNLEMEKQADGTYKTTYQSNGNYSDLILKFENGVLSFSDSRYTGGVFKTMTKS